MSNHTEGTKMLRGMCTVTYYAHDLDAAVRWYTELLGTAPYFDTPGYKEFRIGDSADELGLIDKAYAPPAAAKSPGGAVVFWHVDDLDAAVARVIQLGATEWEPITPRSQGFVTASVLDPWGNILGLMYNPHYVEVVARG